MSVPLTGGDYFALALDRRMRRAGMAGAFCRLAIDLDGRVDAQSLRSALHASGLEPWLANVRLSMPLPFLKPRWRRRRGNGQLPITEHAAEAWAGANLEELLQAGPSPGSPFALSLAHRGSGKTTLVLTWHHAVMDARGAELLLGHINASAAGRPPAEELFFGNTRASLRDQVRGWLRLRSDLRDARQSLRFVDEASRPPIASVTPNGGGNPGSRNRFHLIPFTRDETDRVEANGDRAGAGFRRSLFYLAAAIRALAAVRRQQGAEPASYLVPVPQDRRRRGAAGPIFSNQLSFLFYRGEPEDVASMERLVAALARQMTRQVRERVPDSFAKALDMFQRVPLGWYARLLHGPSGGQFASLFFSDTGESFRGQDSFLGAPITGIQHFAPVGFPPGVAVICSTFRACLSVVLSWVEGCLAEDEVGLLARSLRAELLGIA